MADRHVQTPTRFLLSTATAACLLLPGAASAGSDPADATLAFVESLSRKDRAPEGADIDPTVVSSIVPSSIGNFRALGFHADGHRFSGEIDQRLWTLHLTAQQSDQPTVFRLAFLNSIAVMPERSTVAIVINGHQIGASALRHVGGYGELEFALPEGLLRPGGNLVSMIVDQRHRINCSVAGVYELWTDVDLARTGFEVSAGEGLPARAPKVGSTGDLSQLMGLPTDLEGALPIRVHAAEAAMLSEQSFGVLHELLAQIVLAGGYQQPKVAFLDPSSTKAQAEADAGFDVFIGSSAELSSAFPDLVPATDLGVSKPVVISRGDGARPLLFVPRGTATNTASPAKIVRTHLARPRVKSYSSFTLAEAGSVTRPFNGRQFRTEATFDMPTDFYSADYGVATLSINAAHAGGLSPDAQLRVRVNDQPVASLKLASAVPKTLRNKEVELPLRFFRPGENRIELEAAVAAPHDVTCDPRQRIDPPARFALSGTTSLSFGRLAEAKTLPNLALTLRTGFPYADRSVAGGPISLVVPVPTAGSLTAAMATALHLSLQAGDVLSLRPRFATADMTMTNAIIVGTLSVLSSQTSAYLGLQLPAEHTVPGAENTTDHAALPRTDAPAVDVTFAPLAGAPTQDSTTLLDAIIGSASASPSEGEAGGFSGAISSLWEDRSQPSTNYQSQTIGGQHLTVRQIASPNGQSGAWTIVTAPEDRQLAGGSVGLINKMRSDRLLGVSNVETLAFNNLDQTVTASVAPTTSRIMSSQFSVRNEVLLAAGWMSRNPFSYALGFVLIMVVFGALTQGILRVSGRSHGTVESSGEEAQS
ncbi:MAG: cellulose biosynthesis cyclic di-GMP-binding regulatory protein BcsB [Pseudomonadota bacterium]